MRLLFSLLLPICFSTDNFLSGGFHKNIKGIDEEEEPLKLFSESEEIEGSGEDGSSIQKKIYYIKLYKKIAVDSFERMKKYQRVLEAKADLRNRFRDLEMENIECRYGLDIYLNVSDAKKVYAKYIEFISEMEKTLIKVLSLKMNETETIRSLLRPIEVEEADERMAFLFGKAGIFRKTLIVHKYSDDVFLKFHKLFKNHAIMMTVFEMLKRLTLTSNKSEEAVYNKTVVVYDAYLKRIQDINKWREREGMRFDQLLSIDQISQFKALKDLPQSTHQNCFSFNSSTENFDLKYVYISMKTCGSSVAKRIVIIKPAASTSLLHKECFFQIIRYPLISNSPPIDRGLQAMKFRQSVLDTLKVPQQLNNTNVAEKILQQLPVELTQRLIAIIAVKSLDPFFDNLYITEVAYKISIDAFVENIENCGLQGNSHFCRSTTIPLKITAYYLI